MQHPAHCCQRGSESIMKSSAALILILNAVCVSSQILHEFTYFVGCFLDGSTEVQFEFDGEEMIHVDFSKQEVVYTVPTYIMPDPEQVFVDLNIFKDAIDNKRLCLALTSMEKHAEIHPPEEMDPPVSRIFPSREEEPGVENSLICFVNHFFPPSIKVTWTKNDHPVSEGVSLSQYHPNNDQTFRQFSTLTFTPSEGDIYSCTVEHSALEVPKTRIWEVEFIKADQSLGPVIYCGVGLALGLLGITVGVFFIVKGKHVQ